MCVTTSASRTRCVQLREYVPVYLLMALFYNENTQPVHIPTQHIIMYAAKAGLQSVSIIYCSSILVRVLFSVCLWKQMLWWNVCAPNERMCDRDRHGRLLCRFCTVAMQILRAPMFVFTVFGI